MKKFSVVFLLLAALFFFAACNDEDNENEANNDAETTDEDGNGGNGGNGGKGDGDAVSDADIEPTEESGYITECTPGETRECYEGPSGTKNVGACKSGISTCVDTGDDWSECVGQVVPTAEICSNGIDEDCDGKDMTPENAVDYDSDGYTYCTGDCCETGWEANCYGTDSPERINPGSFEMRDNYVDDNCNGQVDEVEHCDAGLALEVDDYAGNATKLAQAMGACAGLISAELSLAGEPITEQIDTNPNGCGSGEGQEACNPQPRESLKMPYYEGGDSIYKTFAVTPKYGGIVPEDGSNMIAVISTGPWNKPTMNATKATLEAGDMRTASKLPEDWLNMMPNCKIPKAPSCKDGQMPQDGLTNQCAGKAESEIPVGQDPIMLTLKMKVPSNARAFEFSLFFMSIEYPGTVCSDYNYNDFFVALLDSEYNKNNPNAEYRNPYDKNLAKDELGNPVGVDLAPAGLFKACKTDCAAGVNKWHFCTGEDMLIGTGFEAGNGFSSCQYGHGGTGWLRVIGNVEPNEEITLRLALWEQGEVPYGPDHSYDSTVVLDGFTWLPSPAKPGVSPK